MKQQMSSIVSCAPVELIVLVIDLSVCVDGIKLFSNRYSSYSFSLIITKIGTHDLCANAQKTVERIFEILILRFLVNFLKIYCQQQRHLGQQASSSFVCSLLRALGILRMISTLM